MKTVLIHLGVMVLFGLVFMANYLTAPDIEFNGYYLLVIAITVWCLGKVQGYFSALMAILCRMSLSYGPQLSKNDILPVALDAGSVSLIILSFTYLMIKIKSQFAILREMTRTDSLTGAQTSLAFQEQINLELNRSARYYHPLSLLFLDVDDFKKINDTYGHMTANKVLSALARSILSTLRKNDTIGRLGGDEFAVMLVETDQEQLKAVTKKIQNAIDDTSKAFKINLSCSIGAVTVTAGKIIEPEEVICKADEAMYSIKKRGKNSVHYVVLS